MNKNKILGIAIWVLGFFLSMLLMFCLERGMTPVFWVTFGFVIAAFVSVFIFQLCMWKRCASHDNQFIHIPAILVSSGYVLIQIPICIIFALGSSSIPIKIAILVNAFILIIAWIISVFSVAGNDHIRKVNSRQKDHHTEL